MLIFFCELICVFLTPLLFCYSLKGMRAKVWVARSDSPLFDCRQYAQGMEMLYERMWERHVQGLKPDHIAAIADK